MAVDISPAKDKGVLKKILKEGYGTKTPQINSRVKVHYTGTLMNGTKFDSSKDRNQPFEFELGQSQVIKAWDIGIATMKKGEVAVFICAHKYAYGKAGSPPNIPPKSKLKFEVEMIDWVGEDLSPNKDQGITRELITAGDGYLNPNEFALVDIHITGYYEDTKFEDRDVKFTIGEGEAVGIVMGVETALLKFKKGEKSKIFLKSKYAFGTTGKPEYNIPANADVSFEVELKNFEVQKNTWSLTNSEKVEQGKMFKDKGTSFFKDGKYNIAIKMYQKVIVLINDNFDSKGLEDLSKLRDDLLLSANLNLALCFLKTNQPLEAKEACNITLQLDSKNVKALFRRGQAYLEMAAPDLAIKDFQAVAAIEPKNTAAIKHIDICNNKIKKELAKEKKLYANMFDKFAKEDQQKLEEELSKLPDVMHGTLGEWGQEERPGGRDATAFEKENPNILMLNANGTDEFKNM